MQEQNTAAVHPPGSHPLMLGEFLPYRLSILAEAVSGAFARHYERRFGITIPEWRIMAVLGERGLCSTQDIIGRTRMDPAKVSRAALRLEHKGLIARTKAPGDQRAFHLRLRRRGIATYREIVPLAHALQAELVRGFGPAELAAFDGAVDRLLRRVSELAPAVEEPAAGLTPAARSRTW